MPVATASGEEGETILVQACVVAALAAGVALRLAEYLSGRSLSIDEAALARTLIGHGWLGLLGPLDFAQVAPPGFLLVQKAALTFGAYDAVLRAGPLLAGCAALGLAHAAARRVLAPWPTVLFVTLIALGIPLIAYSATSKPYASDVAASLAVLTAALAARRLETPRAAAGFGMTAAITVFLSFTAVFLLGAAALAAIVRAREAADRQASTAHAICAGLWGGAALAGLVIGQALVTADDQAYLHWFWTAGFPPAHGLAARLQWVRAGLGGVFGQTMHYRLSTLWVLAMAIGVWSQVRRHRHADVLILAGPLLLGLLAAAAHLYPLAPGRLELYLVPPALLLAVDGAATAGLVLAQRWGRAWTYLPCLALGALAVHATVGHDLPDEIERHPVRPFLEQVGAHWQHGDAIFVHYEDAQPFLFYAASRRPAREAAVVGACSRGSGRRYLRDVASLKGRRRVWVFMSHRPGLERDLLRSYLVASGVRRQPSAGEDGADGYGYLFDLGHDTGRETTPDAFPLPDALTRDRPFAWSCVGVFAPEPAPAR